MGEEGCLMEGGEGVKVFDGGGRVLGKRDG